MISETSIYLFKIQDSWGIEETTLNADDYVDALKNGYVLIVNEYDYERILCGTEQNKIILYGTRVESKLLFYVRHESSIPPWASVLQAASWSVSETSTSTTLTLASIVGTQKDATIWEYNGGRVIKTCNMMFDWFIKCEINKPCVIALQKGKGCLSELPSDSSYPEIPIKSNQVAVFQPVNCITFGSNVYKPISYEFNGNNKIQQRIACSGFGYGRSEIVNRELTFKITVYSESPDVISPYETMRNGSETEVSFTWGIDSNAMTISTEHANIKNIEEYSTNGLLMWVISGIITNDDLTITINKQVHSVNIGAWQSQNNIGAY